MGFVTTFYHNQNDYWSLYHKVTFDGENKLIIVNDDVTSLDVKIDLYSDWKEWKLLRDHGKFFPALRSIGGDPTVQSQFAGDIYFTINGWRIVVDLTKVRINGVMFSDDFESAWVDKDLNPVYPALAASLVNAIQPSLEGLSIPTSAQNAAAVRTELSPELANMDAAVSTRATQASVDAIQADIDAIEVTLSNMSTVIDTMYKYGKNRTKIDKVAKTMTIYDDDNVTPIKVFDLRDDAGVASVESIYERIPV